MNNIIRAGQWLFGIAITAFGIEFFAFNSSLAGLMPLPSSINQPPWIYIPGLLLIAAGICIILHFRQRLTALLLAVFLLLLCLWLHVPAVLSVITNGGKWTAIFELIALGSGALLTAALPVTKGNVSNDKTNRFSHTIYMTGKILFAMSLVVFGILHFVYATYIATLIPSWIPAPLFLSYFIGAAFIAAAASLFFTLLVTLSSSLLALMFFIWVTILHAPRVLANPQTEAEWTSLFVALAIGAIALQLYGLAANVQSQRKAYQLKVK